MNVPCMASESLTRALGKAALRIAYQDTPDALLPPALQNANPLKIERVIDGRRSSDAIG